MSIFNKMRVANPQYNAFDLSNNSLFTMDGGYIVPFGLTEILPGDVISQQTETFFRLAPLASPFYGNVNTYVRTFYVPNRIIWNFWEEFIGTPKHKNTVAATMPMINIQDISQNNPDLLKLGSLADYLGLPCTPSGTGIGLQYVSALPFMAYQTIYNEYFISQMVEEEIDLDDFLDADGVIPRSLAVKLMTLRTAPWRRDYFTACTPRLDDGLSSVLPVQADVAINYVANYNPDRVYDVNHGPLSNGDPIKVGQLNAGSNRLASEHLGEYKEISIDNSKHLKGSIDQSSLKMTVRDLRMSIALQKMIELMARAGRRYKEQIFAYFGVDVKDSRVDRPEYIGGYKSPILVNDVVQTSETSDNSPLGSLAGRGACFGDSSLKYTAREHGFLLNVIYIVPRASYTSGLPKLWSRLEKLDFYFPQYAQLGDEPVYNKEIYCADDGRNEAVFGYCPRYASYKWKGDEYHGAFKSSMLDWHLGRKFANRPNLNSSFVHVNPEDINRVFAYVGGQTPDPSQNHHFWVSASIGLEIKRKMPYYGDPDPMSNI